MSVTIYYIYPSKLLNKNKIQSVSDWTELLSGHDYSIDMDCSFSLDRIELRNKSVCISSCNHDAINWALDRSFHGNYKLEAASASNLHSTALYVMTMHFTIN